MMPFPTHNEIRLPLLEVLEKLGGQAEPQKVYPKVAEYYAALAHNILKNSQKRKPAQCAV